MANTTRAQLCRVPTDNRMQGAGVVKIEYGPPISLCPCRRCEQDTALRLEVNALELRWVEVVKWRRGDAATWRRGDVATWRGGEASTRRDGETARRQGGDRGGVENFSHPVGREADPCDEVARWAAEEAHD